MISRNPSPPISLYLSILVFNLPPNPPFCLENASLLYLGIRAHQWPINSMFLTLPSEKEDLAMPRRRRLRRCVSKALKSASLVRYSIGPPRCCEVLRHNVECLVAAHPRLLLHFSLSSLLWVFLSIIKLPFLLLYRRVP